MVTCAGGPTKASACNRNSKSQHPTRDEKEAVLYLIGHLANFFPRKEVVYGVIIERMLMRTSCFLSISRQSPIFAPKAFHVRVSFLTSSLESLSPFSSMT